MAIQLGGIVNGLSTGTVTRRRYAAGTITAGVYAKGTATDTPISGVLSVPDAKVLEALESGLRADARYVLHTTADVRTVDDAAGLLPDAIIVNGRAHRPVELEDRTGTHGGFRRLVLVEV